ncbi:uncharacterized protein PAC_10646 [Phialocephala subalpina]|uniref:C2H2-type domain-containing protein n=1 Tax=Phialocephala subalpina TaxID=576137 RepID=A0A1L7X6V0_9HELO|nr:uncharacterized protein PAC_10646 [Phialocephala subalpina]
MDMSSTAPFTPLFGDQPIAMDTDLDIQLYDWSQDDWALETPPDDSVSRALWIGAPRLSPDDSLLWSPPGIGAPQSFLGESMTWSPLATGEYPLAVDDNRWGAALQSDKLSSTDRNLNSFPVSQPEQTSGSARMNQFTNDEPVPMGPSDLLLDYEDQPGATDSNEIAFPSSIQIPLAENSSSTSDHNNDCVTISPPNARYQSYYDGVDLLNLADKYCLVNLPQSVLKQLSKDVAEALRITKEKEQQKSRESREKAAERLRQEKILQKGTTVFKCEHPGCNTTFRRNSERLHHIRDQHTGTTKAFFCPVVDCPMGLRHKFHRIDKFRDHLRGQKISSYPWACTLPGCSKIAPNKAGLIDHFGQHDFQTRRQLSYLLEDYGLNPHRKLDYLAAEYLCSIQGCKFGAYNVVYLSNHMSLAHNGPPRPCPIPNCEAVFQDWQMAPKHLARDHNHTTRMQFEDEIRKLHFDLDESFSCPICQHEVEHASHRSVHDHCQEHDKQQLLCASKTIFDAWSFSLGPRTVLVYAEGNFKDILLTTENKLLASIVLSDEERRALGDSGEAFEQAGAKLRASMDLSKDGPQN